MPRIGKTFTFDAAHRLQRHGGKCRGLHGHTYHVEVTIGAIGLIEAGPSAGMVLDFGEVKDWWKQLEWKLDHCTLLEADDPAVEAVKPFAVVTTFDFPPTAENLAGWIYEDLANFMVHKIGVGMTLSVRVYETPTSWAQA